MAQSETQALQTTGARALTEQERNVAHQALDRLLDSEIGGSTHDPDVAAAFMEIAARKHILLTPVMGAFRMRPGWELAFTKLKVDTSKEAKLVYKVGGDEDDDQRGGGRDWGPMTPLAFHKPLLNMIRTHLGINIETMTRIDDRSKDYRYEFQVTGNYLSIDGQIRPLLDQGGLDLSDGSEACQKIINETRGNSPEEKQRKAMATITRKRAKVLQFATTNAEERLIISYGFRSSYTKGELDSKYIVCVRPIFTGYHPDPETRGRLMDYMLNQQDKAATALYGVTSGTTPQVRSLPASLGQPTDIAEKAFDVQPEPEKPKAWIVPFGKHKDKPITEVPDSDLSGLVDMCLMVKDNADMKGQHEAYAGYQKEIEAEVERRKGEKY
jgi:hypothetical protein